MQKSKKLTQTLKKRVTSRVKHTLYSIATKLGNAPDGLLYDDKKFAIKECKWYNDPPCKPKFKVFKVEFIERSTEI